MYLGNTLNDDYINTIKVKMILPSFEIITCTEVQLIIILKYSKMLQSLIMYAFIFLN